MDFLRMRLNSMFLDDTRLLNVDLIKKYVDKFLDDPIPLEHGKVQDERVHMFREIGDKLILDEEYDDAISTYTKGLQVTLPFSKLAAGFYHRRAEALEKLGFYKESLLDIDRALQFPLSRQIRNYILEKKIKIEHKVTQMKSTKTNGKGASKSYLEVPKLSYEENKDVPGTSDAIRVTHDSEYGRHIVATKPIKLGDVVLIEKPCIAYLFSDKNEMCHHCMEYSKALIPCDFCAYVLFCSENCRKEAYETYHKAECIYGSCSDDLKIALRLLLTITDNGAKLEEAKEFCKNLDAQNNDFMNLRTSDIVVENDLQSILYLSTSMKKSNTVENHVQAAALATMLRNYSNYMNGNNDVLEVAKLILRVIYIVKTKITKVQSRNDKDSLAVAFYPLFNTVYHSCCANTMYSIHKGNVLALHATKDIKAGEQITFNFIGAGVIKLSSPERRDFILMKRNIICKCEACMSNYDFKPELRRKLDIPEQLKRRLRKCPTEIPSMWEILKIIDNEIKKPCLEMELLKVAISEAYMERQSPVIWSLYNGIGIF